MTEKAPVAFIHGELARESLYHQLCVLRLEHERRTDLQDTLVSASAADQDSVRS